jgi:acyl carrier protein
MSEPAIRMCDLVALVSELAGDSVDLTQATEDTRFIDDIGMDSITLVALVFLCEERFGLDLSGHADQVGELLTLGQSLDFLNRCRLLEGDTLT